MVPPSGATWATITLEARATPRSRDLAGPCAYMLHTTQLLPSTSISKAESCQRISLALPTADGVPPAQHIHSVAVTGGVTMEVTVAQWWMSLGETEVCNGTSM